VRVLGKELKLPSREGRGGDFALFQDNGTFPLERVLFCGIKLGAGSHSGSVKAELFRGLSSGLGGEEDPPGSWGKANLAYEGCLPTESAKDVCS